MRHNPNTFPVQKLPLSKKNDEWKETCVDYIIGSGESARNGQDRTRVDEMQTYYDLYNSIYNEKDLKYVTNPFKQDDGFPATAQDYNIIRPKIDLLIGEETKRPFNFKVCRTSDTATSEVQDKAKQMLLDYVQASMMAKMGPEEQQKYQEALQSGEIMQPEAIQRYLTRDYKDIAETTAYHTINYLRRKNNIDHEFIKGWKDALISSEEIYYVGIINGEPILEKVNPLYFDYESSADLEFIHEASWCCRKMFMSYSDVYDRFYDKMTEKQLDELLDLIQGKPGSHGDDRGPKDDYNHIKMHINHTPFESGDTITVYHTCWKSFKKIGFVTIQDETGEQKELKVDETYKPIGNEVSVEWDWIIEVWEGYRVGDDLYIGIQPVEYQHVSADNPNAQKLPYTGAVYSNTNSKPRSLVSIMKPLQYMYIVVWYRLEMAMARDKGKVLTIDITQIPKGLGIDVNKWMHYLSALGVNFVNPYDEGWDIPGREGGKPSQFNQITAVDLTMANVIDQYINLMSKIENMISEISGVSPQREGAIASNELVGNVTRAVVQSANITEPLFWLHNQVKKHAVTMLLDTARVAWRNNSKESLNYILDDTTRAFIKFSDDFYYEDMDIFVSDSTKDQQVVEQLRNLMQPAMQNGATLLDVAEIMTLDNTTLIKNKLEEIENKRIQQQQAMQDQQSQQQQQLVQLQNQYKEAEQMLKQAELDLKRYEIDSRNATAITTAEISAYRGSENMDVDQNGIPDPIEIGNQAIAQQKVDSERTAKQMELTNKQREIEYKKDVEQKKIDAQKRSDELKNTIERERIALENRKLEAAKQLQQAKDVAAYKREELKAKTAMKNKVVGQK